MTQQLGPWSPGLVSQVPAELRHLCTIFRPENSFTSVASATELQQLTGLPLCELVAFRPQRLLLHELLIRVMADFSVPDGSRIGDLGINFREMTRRLLEGHIAPELPAIIGEYERIHQALAVEVTSTFAAVTGAQALQRSHPQHSLLARLFSRRSHHPQPAQQSTTAGPTHWGPREIAQCEQLASGSHDGLRRAACQALARVMSGLFTTHGYAWGTPELIQEVATNLACNACAGEAIGQWLEPILARAAPSEGYSLLPKQEKPVIINTKGPSASGKSTLRPLQKKLAGDIGVHWRDFALISPDIWRKQLLDYASLGGAFRYAGAFTSEELQIIDQKLDRYMARKQTRGEMSHLLIDRFRFDSFAPDSDEAGSNLLTRFGDSVYLFFVITPPEQLVERAWVRGLEFGRYKAVDDTLAHGVEAYTGMPNVFFTWVNRTDKRIHIELLDNTVQLGELPRTVAFGDNYTLNVLDVDKLLDIERFGRVDINATTPQGLYPDRALLAAKHNVGFLKRSIQAFREVNFAEQDTGRVYVRIRGGAPVMIDPEALPRAAQDPNIRAALLAVAPGVLSAPARPLEQPLYLSEIEGPAGQQPTLGQWGRGHIPVANRC
jgi:hypothetical protein